jgi:hypothetical protein
MPVVGDDIPQTAPLTASEIAARRKVSRGFGPSTSSPRCISDLFLPARHLRQQLVLVMFSYLTRYALLALTSLGGQ